MAEIPKETEQKIGKLQMIEQSIQNMLAQKQQFQTQLIEIESALKEIENSKESYKIVGNIMIKSDKATLQKELDDKKEIATLRIRTLEKQEKSTRDKAKIIQEEVMQQIQKEK